MPTTDSRLRIGFATRRDARDARSWSGIPYRMAASLATQGAEILHIGPMEVSDLRTSVRLQKVRRRLGLRPALPMQSRAASRSFARQISDAVQDVDPQVIFSPVGSAILSDFGGTLPTVYSSDATFRLMQGYYPKYTNITSRAAREADVVERRTIERSDLIVYPTEWVARSAIDHYGADTQKVHVVPYGANIDPPDRERALAERQAGPLRLLFVGVDWQRKGGDIAMHAAETLNRRGTEAALTVIGCRPPAQREDAWLTVIPFLDKNDPAARAELAEHYLNADVFILPTRQECYGIVFCEAAAYGLPVVATDTGGVSGVVRHGETGRLLPPEAEGPDYADAIESILSTPGGLTEYRRNARDEYESCLNWDAWAARVYLLMQELVVGSPPSA